MSVVGVGNNYYSAFNPLNLGDCALWLDAADTSTLTLSGSNVTQWRDKTSGLVFSNFTGTPTYSNNFRSGNGVISLFGTSSLNNTTLTISNANYSIFMIAYLQSSNATNYIRILNGGGGAGDVFLFIGTFNGTANYATFTGSGSAWNDVNSNTPATSILQSWRLMGMTVVSSALTPYLDGTAQNTKTGTTGAFTGLNVGGVYSTNQTQQCFQGYIGEILIYNFAPSAVQRQQVEAYLARKWGLLGGGMQSITTFTPRNISNCALWLDAADSSTLTLSGSNVTGWRDKSGTNRTVTFAGSNVYTANTSVNTSAPNSAFFYANVDMRKTTVTYATVFTVHTWTGSGLSTNQTLWGADDGGGWNRTQLLSFPTFSSVSYGLSYTGSSPQVLIISNINTTSRTIYSSTYAYLISNGTFATVNGSSSTTVTEGAAATQTSSQNTYFGASQLNANIGSVNFHEIIIYTSSTSNITTTERQNIEGYLARKWGLTSSLPSTHPYALRGLPTTHLYYSIPPITRGFAPIDIPGCTVWLDAADPNSLTLSGSNVTQWRDKSGNGTNASQATTSNQPIYQSNSMNGLPSIQFNAISRNNLVCFDTTAFDFGTSARTAFFVIRNNFVSGTVAASPHWFWPKTGNGTNALSLVGWISAGVQGQAGGASATYNRNQICLVGYRFGSTSAFEELFSNSTSVATFTKTTGGSSYANATSGYRIGGLDNADVGNSLYWFDGNIGEILMFNRALTTSERQTIEGYLARKWGLLGGGMQPITTFTPTSVTGCQLWLDAADSNSLTLSGSSVTQWRDKSSNNYSSTVYNSPTYSSNSLNGFPGVTFNGTSQYMDFGNVLNIGTSSIYVFVISKFDSTANGGIIGKTSARGGVTGRWALYRFAGDGGLGYLFDNSNGSTSGFVADSSTEPRLLTLYWDRANSFLLQNGSQIITRSFAYTSNFTGTDPLYVAAYPNSTATAPAFYYPGKIGEILVYLGSLTSTDRQNIEGYLARKWGLTSSLPSTHPYAALRGLPSTHPFISRMPATTVFNPRQISGCALWLDAADPTNITFSGSNITQWNDRSGNGYNLTQATASSGPLLSNNYVVFSSNRFLNIPQAALNNTSTYSIFLVINPIATSNWIFAKQHDGVNTHNILSMTVNTSSGGAGQVGTSQFMYWRPYNAGTQANSTTAFSTSTTVVFGLIYNGTNMLMYRNGTLLSTTASAAGAIQNQTSATNFTLGAWIVSGSFANPGVTNFQLGEMMFFSKSLLDSERRQVEGYLAWKWGLNGGYSPSIAPFTPTSVSGCQLWLDAADSNSVTETTGSITNVTNKGNSSIVLSNANGFTYDRTNRAFTNSVASSSRHLGINSSYSQAQPQTLFAVASFSSSSTNPYIIDSRSTQVDVGRFAYSIIRNGANTADVAYAFAGNIQGPDYGLRTSTNISSNTTLIHTLVMNNSSSDVRLNGVTQSWTQAPGTNSMTGITVANRYSDNQSWVGSINEILLYGRGLTLTERENIEGYLANKWGLTGSLPSSHPYTNRSLPSTHPYKLIQPGFINATTSLVFTYAWYGSTNGGSGRNVTSTVQSVYDSGAATITLGNGTFGDPQPGIQKFTWITYTKSGTSISIGPYNEGTVLTFSTL